jgi:ubiquinone/menaquinone biosynthesis C-methylase UbiE
VSSVPLDAEGARRFYDRLGRLQDTQAFYENAATARLVKLGCFAQARSVFELGCGTGRFGAQLLATTLPADTRYLGVDVSSTMVGLARARLARWAPRAEVRSLELPATTLPGDDGAFDRFAATYVLDLLPTEESYLLIAEARRLLGPDGRLAMVSLTHGETGASRLVSRAWGAVSRRWPGLVGGCRPISLRDLLADDDWRVEQREVVTTWGIPSEVLVAHPRRW